MYHLTFGTDGIRARVGSEPLTQQSVQTIGTAIARWAQKKYNNRPRMLLAHDTRNSCAWLKATLKSGLLSSPLEITDAGILPTPAIAALLGHTKKFDFGISITASHNAYGDNGIKIITSTDGKLTVADEQKISELAQQQPVPDYTLFGVDNQMDLTKTYSDIVCSFFPEKFLQGIAVILDCAQGATYTVAPEIFKRLGADVITINAQPTGFNINEKCGSTSPAALQQTVLAEKADIGFAFDGDGDRLLVIDSQGDIKDGDDILALLSQHTQYKGNNSIVGTVMSNQGLVQYLANHNKTLIRAGVGDKYVAEQLQRHNLSLGGEPSGHIICGDYAPCGDGIFTALRMVESLQKTNNWAMNTFKKFPNILVNVTITKRRDLTQSPLADIIATSAQQIPNGRVLVRYSGTEPLLRIMVEDEDRARAERVCLELQKICIKELT